ncbi:hypothetical protein [Nocardia sp. NPDC057668]|uniref:hypothetical protein n=1 Tax=Nocardia sp. NPDC057668 TaxID=3346202 RepID=UPI00366BD04B
MKPTSDRSPDIDAATVDGVTVGSAIYVGPCGNYDEAVYDYRVPAGSSTLSAKIAAGDRSATDTQVQVEFFLDKARAAVVTPRLGVPAEVILEVTGVNTLSVRSYSEKSDSCGESRGVVLTKAEFSTAQNPAAKKAADGPSEYVVENDPVSDECDSFYFHSDTDPMHLSGRTNYHSLSAGRDGDIGADESGPCTFEYDLGRSATKIVATAGVHDASRTTFTCRAELSIDGKPVQTNDLSLGNTVPVDIPVPNALRLRVVFTFLGPGYGECVLGDFRIMRARA